MSYKLRVIRDNPLVFLPMDSITSSNVNSYQDLINNYTDYSDVSASFVDYKTISENVVPDQSGCGNDGYLVGSFSYSGLPLVYGFHNSTRIDNSDYIVLPISNNYYGQIDYAAFGTLDSSDNDFTLEAWVDINSSTDATFPILADQTNNVGLFYHNGCIFFRLNNEEIIYTIPYIDKSIHVVGKYSGHEMSIYVDGDLKISKEVIDFKFSNSSILLQSGPVPNISDYFYVNCLSVYRYGLTESTIKDHYTYAQSLPGMQIVYPDNGELFEFYDNALNTQYSYSYPANKPWSTFLTDALVYDVINDAISIPLGTGESQEVILEDFITIPSGPDMDDSRIEWYGDTGISVETSIDGITYSECKNGQTVPGYGLGGFDSSRSLYIRVTISTIDDSEYLPKLYSLSISFYNNQIMYAQNSGSYFSKSTSLPGLTSYEANLSNKKYPILSRDNRNGIKVENGSAFLINTESSVQTLEFFYTPLESGPGALINTPGGNGYSSANFSWNSSGVISKTNITGVYVNGQDKTTETNIANIFIPGDFYHVMITFGGAISGGLRINYSSAGSIKSIYQNLAIYPGQLGWYEDIQHYLSYTGAFPINITNSLMTLTENSTTYYNPDWKVIQNI